MVFQSCIYFILVDNKIYNMVLVYAVFIFMESYTISVFKKNRNPYITKISKNKTISNSKAANSCGFAIYKE